MQTFARITRSTSVIVRGHVGHGASGESKVCRCHLQHAAIAVKNERAQSKAGQRAHADGEGRNQNQPEKRRGQKLCIGLLASIEGKLGRDRSASYEGNHRAVPCPPWAAARSYVARSTSPPMAFELLTRLIIAGV